MSTGAACTCTCPSASDTQANCSRLFTNVGHDNPLGAESLKKLATDVGSKTGGRLRNAARGELLRQVTTAAARRHSSLQRRPAHDGAEHLESFAVLRCAVFMSYCQMSCQFTFAPGNKDDGLVSLTQKPREKILPQKEEMLKIAE